MFPPFKSSNFMLGEVDPFLQDDDDGGVFFEAVRDEDDVKHKV